MTKAELVDKVAATIQLPKHQTTTVVDLFLQCIIDALSIGDKVELRGFGSFRLRHRAPRAGRNPKTGETVQVPAKQVPWFKVTFPHRVRIDFLRSSMPNIPKKASFQECSPKKKWRRPPQLPLSETKVSQYGVSD